MSGKRLSIRECQNVIHMLGLHIAENRIATLFRMKPETVQYIREAVERADKHGTAGLHTGTCLLRAIEIERGLPTGAIKREGPKYKVEKRKQPPVEYYDSPMTKVGQMSIVDFLPEPEDKMDQIIRILSGIMSELNELVQLVGEREELPL